MTGVPGRTSALLVLVAALAFQAPARALGSGAPAILLLTSYHRGFPWTDAETQGALAVLRQRWPEVHPFVENLDRKRFPDAESEARFRRYLREKYQSVPLAGLIVTDDAALAFALKETEGPLANLPLSFAGVNGPVEALSTRPRTTGVVEQVDVAGTFALIRALQPDARTFLVVLDRTETSEAIRPRIAAASAVLGARVQVQVLGGDLSHAELARRAASLDRKTALVLGSFNVDREGRYASYEAVAEEVSAVSGAPVYGFWDFQLGHGIVGGSLLGGAAQGRRAAELLLALLEGRPAPIDRGAAAYLALDHPAASRFGLDPDAAPEGTLVQDRPERVWERHRAWFVSASVAVAVLLAAAAVLLELLRRMRQTKRLLAESEDRYRTILDSVEDAVFLHDAGSFGLQDVNRRACELYGATRDWLRTGGVAAISSGVRPYTLEDAARWLERAKRDGPQRFEWHARRADGTLFWVDVAIRPSTIGGHSVLVVAVRDIEERKAAERALHESERRFRELTDLLPQVIFECDLQGRLTFVNQRAFEVFGVGREALALRPRAVDFLVPEQREQGMQNIGRSLTGMPATGNEYQAVRPDGGTFPVMIYSSPVFLDGRPVGLRGLIVDITERKRAEAEQATLQRRLEEGQRLESLGRLAGGVAHDFNNLLTPILGNAELALTELGPEHPLAADLKGILDAATRAGSLTRQLLAFGRRQVLQHRVLDLNAEVEALYAILRRTIGEDVEVRLALATELWPVRGDPSQVHQVLLNLAMNARAAMPNGGVLTIRTRNVPGPGPERVELLVSDTGVGMPPEVRARLFEPFFTTKPLGKGTGLGLATVLGVVQQHGGEIEVETEVGKGTTFRVVLPRTVEEQQQAAPRAQAVPQPARRGTILVAEDEPGVRRLVETLLTNVGHRVLVAKDGEEALALATAHEGTIDLLLTDVVMPGMNGRELHLALHRQRPGLPVLYMSGYPALPGTLQDILDGQRDDVLHKPFTRAELLARVDKRLGA